MICFIVLHYLCYEETKACVDSILNLANQDIIRTVIVDNCSQNDSYQRLCKSYSQLPSIKLVHNDENLGFSKANNIGLMHAKKQWDIKFAVFTNNDIIFNDKHFIEKVFQEYEKSRFAVLGPDIYNTKLKIHQSPINPKYVVDIPRVKRTIIFNQIALALFPLYYALFDRGKEVTATHVPENQLYYQKGVVPLGACLIVSDILINRLEGVFYPETVFYYEEVILCYWCMKHRETIVFNPDLKVLHNHGMATKSVGNPKAVAKFRLKNILAAAKCYHRLIRSCP